VKCFRLAIFAAILSLWLTRTGFGQGVTGSATLDIDADLGVVIATCETDLDVSAQAFYVAEVECTVEDASGKKIISERFFDKNGAKGYAQGVLTFMGVPGTTYTVTASHDVEVVLDRYIESSPGQTSLYDPLKFGDLDKLHQTYENMYEWFGTGLGTQGRK
jgi:hypothetical protein